MTAVPMVAEADEAVWFEKSLYRKVGLRVVPILFLGYFLAYLDRVNVGFAKLSMLSDLRFSEAIYGAGAGAFFIGYFIFQVPSNLILQKVGARRWIAFATVAWGAVSASSALVHTPFEFYLARLMLGATEAGFFPGAILYLSYWFPKRQRAKMTALLLAGNPVSGLLGGPLSGLIMHGFSDSHVLASWQWLFIVEAAPSALLALIYLVFLDDGIQGARWLTAEQKAFITAQIAAEASEKIEIPLRSVFTNRRVWMMVVLNFGVVMGTSAVGFWTPTILRESGIKDVLQIGVFTMVPYAAAILTMVLTGYSADHRREYRWHVAGPMIGAAIGFLICTQAQGHVSFAVLGLTVAVSGALTSLPMFWVLPAGFLGGTAAAAGIAFINCAGSLSGFVGPAILGLLKDRTGSLAPGLTLVAASLIGVAILVLLYVPRRSAGPTER